MTDQEKADLGLAGYFVKEQSNGTIMIEGTTNETDWIIEYDFEAYWVYEYTGESYHSVDAFGVLEDALELVRKF